jgi:hypothetical protein
MPLGMRRVINTWGELTVLVYNGALPVLAVLITLVSSRCRRKKNKLVGAKA